MSKQHYDLATYKTQLNVGYLVKRTHSLMHDIMEPLIEQHGATCAYCGRRVPAGGAISPEGHEHRLGSQDREVDERAFAGQG